MALFVEWLVRIALLYMLVGVVFGIPFVLRGANRIDPVAPGSSWGFRLMILPGVAALWPLLALRWIRRSGPPEERVLRDGRAVNAEVLDFVAEPVTITGRLVRMGDVLVFSADPAIHRRLSP